MTIGRFGRAAMRIFSFLLLMTIIVVILVALFGCSHVPAPQHDGKCRTIEYLNDCSSDAGGAWISGRTLCAMRNERRPLWAADALGATWIASTEDIFRRSGLTGSTVTEIEPNVMVFL